MDAYLDLDRDISNVIATLTWVLTWEWALAPDTMLTTNYLLIKFL